MPQTQFGQAPQAVPLQPMYGHAQPVQPVQPMYYGNGHGQQPMYGNAQPMQSQAMSPAKTQFDPNTGLPIAGTGPQFDPVSGNPVGHHFVPGVNAPAPQPVNGVQGHQQAVVGLGPPQAGPAYNPANPGAPASRR